LQQALLPWRGKRLCGEEGRKQVFKEIWKSLAPGGDSVKILHALEKPGKDYRVLIVGHEPCLSMLISRIISGRDDTSIVLGKGSFAKIRNYPVVNDAAVGELQWLVDPKLIGLKR